jgi:hypothetical protein
VGAIELNRKSFAPAYVVALYRNGEDAEGLYSKPYDRQERSVFDKVVPCVRKPSDLSKYSDLRKH